MPLNDIEPGLHAKQYDKVKITEWKNNAAAALTLSFDDGYKETLENCAYYLAKHKLKATWNVPTAYVGGIFEGQEVVSWTDIAEIAQESGMEIASHSVNHLNLSISPLEYLRKIPVGFYHARSKLAYLRQIIKMAYRLLFHRQQKRNSEKTIENDIKYEATASKSEIDKHVPSQITLSYVYPFGKCNQPYKDCVNSAGYICGRSTRKGYNIYKKIDLFDLRCMVWSKDTTVKEANSWINKAMVTRAWLIETYHLVAEDNRSAYEWFSSSKAFRQHVDYFSNLAENNKVWIDTQQNVAKYIKQRLNSEAVIIHQDSSSYILRLSSKLAQLSDQDLTLIVEIPYQWHKVRISQGGKPVATQKEKNFVLFNALPNTESILIENSR